MSFTPGAPTRRSFKEDREDRRRRKEGKQRFRIVAAIAVLLIVGVVAWAVYAQAAITATLTSWHLLRPAPRASVSMHTVAFHPTTKVPKVSPFLYPGVTPTPGLTPTPVPTATPVPTPTPAPTPTPHKTPKPKSIATKPAKPQTVAVSTPFGLGPTPAPIPTTAPTLAPTPAPATATPPAEVFAPQIVVDARFANRVQPDYPEIAREQQASGTAVVLVTVGPKGNVLSQRLEKSAGHPSLDQAALSAAARSSFLPPKIDGKPATETYRIYYAFAP